MTSYHCSRVFPLGQFVEDPQQINAGKKISPAELIVVSCFLKKNKRIKKMASALRNRRPSNTHNAITTDQTLCSQLWELVHHTVRKVKHRDAVKKQKTETSRIVQ